MLPCTILFLISVCSAEVEEVTMNAQQEAQFYQALADQRARVEILKGDGYILGENITKVLSEVDVQLYDGNNIGDFPPLIMVILNSYARILEALKDFLKPGNRALNTDSGSGYLTVCMALLCGETGYVVVAGNFSKEFELAKRNIQQYHPWLLKSKRIKFVETKAKKFGNYKLSLYDAMYVGQVDTPITEEVTDQLQFHGRLVIPVHDKRGHSKLRVFDKYLDGYIAETELPGTMHKIIFTTEKHNFQN